MRIPQRREVRQALRSAEKAVSASRQGINDAAAERMARGDYERAERLIAKGREIQAFEAELRALRERWRQLGGSGGHRRGREGSPTTPLWAFYRPLLQALVKLGGEARRAELEPEVERLLEPTLQPGDREPMARGRERWQVMIRRARKHMAAEGWIEEGRSPVWKLTEAGRQAADKARAQSRSRE